MLSSQKAQDPLDEAIVGNIKEINKELNALINHIESNDAAEDSCFSAGLDMIDSRLVVVKKLIKNRR